MEYLTYLAALMIGLLGGAHCMAMCGGVIGALSMAIDPGNQRRKYWIILSYNFGRILSYVAIALIFFLLVNNLAWYFSFSYLRVFSGVLLVAMGLYLANWWRGIAHIEKLGNRLWRNIQPLSKFFLPVKTKWQALLLGMIWGWLPCGLIYSVLVYSATASSAPEAALMMLSFGLGTLPAVLLSGVLVQKILSKSFQRYVRIPAALMLMIYGLWIVYSGLYHF